VGLDINLYEQELFDERFLVEKHDLRLDLEQTLGKPQRLWTCLMMQNLNSMIVGVPYNPLSCQIKNGTRWH